MEDLWFEHPVPWTIDSKTFMIVSDPGCHHIWCTILVIYCYLVTHLPKSLTNPEAWNWKFKRRIWTAGYLCQGQSIKWMTAIKRLHTRHNWQRQSPNICFMLSMPLLIPWKNTWKMFNSPVFFPGWSHYDGQYHINHMGHDVRTHRSLIEIDHSFKTREDARGYLQERAPFREVTYNALSSPQASSSMLTVVNGFDKARFYRGLEQAQTGTEDRRLSLPGQ